MQWADSTDAVTGLKQYRLKDFDSQEEALEANYEVTHLGHCGSCSSLQDLGVYLSRNLTEPTRICGALAFISLDLEKKCLEQLGFSFTCGTIWHWNIENTSEVCRR